MLCLCTQTRVINMNSIMTFHWVDDSVWFDSVVCFLKSRYRLVSVESLYECHFTSKYPTNVCHITVDDGDKSFYEIIFPVLRKHKVQASLFVSPRICTERANFWFQEIEGYDENELKRIIADILNMSLSRLMKYSVESILKTMPIHQISEVILQYQRMTNAPPKEFRNISCVHLKDVATSGLVSIGAHTMNHPILRNEDDSNCLYEISQSLSELSTLLNKEINMFAYPNGIPGLDFTEREERYLRNCGVQLAFTTESRHLSLVDNRMCIPRIQIRNKESILSISSKMLLGSKWNTLKKLKRTGEYAERKRLSCIMSTEMISV